VQEDYLQLTILSSELVKASVLEDAQISVSCNASELPKYNFTLLLQRQSQDLGPIGFLVFDERRPLISALATLSDPVFNEFFDLVRFTPPRNPSLFLKINDIKSLIEISKQENVNQSKFQIHDIGWRFPLT